MTEPEFSIPDSPRSREFQKGFPSTLKNLIMSASLKLYYFPSSGRFGALSADGRTESHPTPARQKRDADEKVGWSGGWQVVQTPLSAVDECQGSHWDSLPVGV